MTFNDLTKEQKLILKECQLFKWQVTTPFGMEDSLSYEDIDRFVSDEDIREEYTNEELDYMFKNENNSD